MADENWSQDESSNVDPFNEIDLFNNYSRDHSNKTYESGRHLAFCSKLFSPESNKDGDCPREGVPKYL